MSAYLYPSTSAHRAPLFFEDNDLFQAFGGGGCRRSYEDPFSHAIRLAQVEEEARRQRVVAKARARAQAEAAEARRLYQLRLEQEQEQERRRRQQILYQQQVARAQAERQRRAELAAAREEADFIEALQQHIFGGAQRQAAIERQRALEQQEQRRQAEIAHQRKLQARRRQEQEEAQRQRQQPFAIEDVFGSQFLEQTFENFLAPFLGSLMQQESNDEDETVAAPATAAEKGKAVDRSAPAQEAPAPAAKAASTDSTQDKAEEVTTHETVRSIPIDSVKKVPSPPASEAGSSTRGRSRSPKRARVSDVDEEGNEIATGQEQEEEDYVRLSEAGSEH